MSGELGEADKFELSSVVTKNSRTGITSNRRLLVIKGGKLYYYSNIPKFFDGNIKALEVAHQLPKCSIDILNIRSINEFDLNSPYFSIEFLAKHLMEKEDIRNSSMNNDYNFTPKDTSEEVTWQFTCDNQFIKKRWVSALKSLKDYYKEQDIKLQKWAENLEKSSPPLEDPKSSSYSSRSSIKMPLPWRESGFSRKSYNLDKGLQFKESSSPKDHRVDDLSFLKMGTSDRNLEQKNQQPSFQMIIQEADLRAPQPPPSLNTKALQPENYLKPTSSPKTPLSPPQSNSNEPSPKQSDRWTDDKIENVFKMQAKKDMEERKIADKKSAERKSAGKKESPSTLALAVAIEEVPEELSVPPTPTKNDNNISYSDSDSHIEKKLSAEKLLAEMKFLNSEEGKKKKLNLHQSYSIELKGLPVVEQKLEFNSSQSFAQESVSQDKYAPQLNISVKVASQMPSDFLKSKASQPQEQYILDDQGSRLSHPAQETHSFSRGEEGEGFQGQEFLESQAQSGKGQQIQCENRFEWLWGQSCIGSLPFYKKLLTQKELLAQMFSFKQRAIQSLSSWLQSKARGEKRYPVIEESSRYLTLEMGRIRLKIANMSTQKLVINGANKIFYNEEPIKNLKRQFKVYQHLFQTISRQLKNDNYFGLRVPLCIYLQYKGVCCLATRLETQVKTKVQESNWQSQFNFLLGQGYKTEWFSFREVGKHLQLSVKTKSKFMDKDQENLKEHLKKIVLVGSREKNHNLVFDSPISKSFLRVATLENSSTSIQSLERYIKGLRLAKGLQGPCPKEQIIEALSYCVTCKQLRKVYRSAQGEIGETHFFNLLFKRDPSLLDMLQHSDCTLPRKVTAQLFSFIQHYFGIILQIDEKTYLDQYILGAEKVGSKDLFVSSRIKPIVREYSLEGFEVVETFSKLQQYIDSRSPLAKEALMKKKEVFGLSQDLSQEQELQLIYNEAGYLYSESDFTGCIKKCREYQQSCTAKSPALFPLYLLMMKAYSHFSESDFTAIFQKAISLVQFNYGPQNSCLISLKSLAAFYYLKLGSLNHKMAPKLREISVELMKQAQQLCLSLFSNKSKQYLDIQLDSSRLMSGLDLGASGAHLQEAKKICQSSPLLSTPENILALLSYEAELSIKRGNFEHAERVLASSLSMVDNKTPLRTRAHLFKLQHELGFYQQKFDACQQAIEQLWQLGTPQKLEALEMAYKLAFKETAESESEHVPGEGELGQVGWERGLSELEQEKEQHGGLVDLLVTAIENNKSKTLALSATLIHHQRHFS